MRLSGSKLTPIPALAQKPSGDEWYLAYYRASIGEYVMYHNLHDAIRPAKKADVLFLGNSRTMFALGQKKLQPFFERLGLRYYVMAFPYHEQNRFPEAIIQKYNLRPKWLIVNVDPFFINKISPFARKVMSEDRWEAWKFKLETELAFRVRGYVHCVVPYYEVDRPGAAEWIAFGSYRDGTMQIVNTYGQSVPFKSLFTEQDTDLTPQILRSARRFQRDMERRGTRIVLTTIPPRPPKLVIDLGAALGVPVVVPNVDGLQSCDGSHFDPASAARYADAFLAELEKVVAGRSPNEPLGQP